MRAPTGAAVDLSKVPTLKPAPRALNPPPATRKPDKASPPPGPAAAPLPQQTLTDAQVLRILEQRRASGSPAGKSGTAEVAVLRPEDTNTRLAMQDSVARDAPVFFAVQLQWSVQSIDVNSVPRDPIFQAYTLYAAEGRRAGRTWFFLRVGFFSDAVSAKQVAQYLRKNFSSAAVVPVSPAEREQAKQMGRSTASAVAHSPSRPAK